MSAMAETMARRKAIGPGLRTRMVELLTREVPG